MKSEDVDDTWYLLTAVQGPFVISLERLLTGLMTITALDTHMQRTLSHPAFTVQ